MARAPFPIADRVSLADVGEYMKRKNDLHEGLARDDVQAALVDGCGVELIWIKEGREVCREYPKPDFFRRPILTWHGLVPRRLHIQLPPEEQKGDTLLTFLRLSDAVRYGLQPVSELPQAEQQSKQQSEQQSREEGETASIDARASRRRRSSGGGAIKTAVTKEDGALPASEAARRKRGRPTKITPKLEQYIFGLLDHHGLPDPNDPEWSSQANIEEIIQAQSGCEKTQAREHARRLIDLWQAGKAGKAGK